MGVRVLDLAERLRPHLAAADGRGVRVVLIDTGVDPAHPELATRRVDSFAVDPRTRDVLTAAPGDPHGHGTAVARLLAALAPGVELASVRALDPDRTGQSACTLAALDWAIRRGFDVINCSFVANLHAELYAALVEQAYRERRLIVAAAHNHSSSTRVYPAWHPAAIAVDYHDLPDGGEVWARRRHLVEFIAHGRGPAPLRQSGTSFAVARVSALVARLRQVGPDWSASQVKAALHALATRVFEDGLEVTGAPAPSAPDGSAGGAASRGGGAGVRARPG